MSENISEALESARQEIERLTVALRAEKLKTQITSEMTNVGLWEYDIAADTLFQFKKINGRFEDISDTVPHFRDTVITRGLVLTEDVPLFKKFCDAMRAGEREVGCDVRVINDKNEIVWFRYTGKTVFDSDGKAIKVVGRTLDVTKEKGGDSDGSASGAGHDPLTNTSSPEVFRNFVEEKRSGKNRYNSAALMGICVDNFRDIEAKCGREYSDYVQKIVAKILTSVCAVERDRMVTRVRSGEFLMYLGFSDANVVDEAARKIVDSVRDYSYDGEAVTVSVGIALCKAGKPLNEAYDEASRAMSEAARSGGGCFVHYTMAMSSGIYGGSAEISPDNELLRLSNDASKVYNMIIRAFCETSERAAMIKEAFRAAGQCVGASAIYIFTKNEQGFARSMIYNADDRPEEMCAGLEITCPEEELEMVLGGGNAMRIHSAEMLFDGLTLTNGAVCAECRAIRVEGAIKAIFAVVFESSFELTDSDIRIIDVLEDALTSMFRTYEDGLDARSRRRLHTTIINNHRIEGFSIIPGTFVVDYIGKNAAEHYDIAPGDICYQKMRGRDTPCENCPAVMLEQQGTFFASAAQYFENEQRWLDVTASVDEDNFGERRYVISSTDITDCLGRIQMTDRLTGLMTFNVFTAEALRMASMLESTAGLYAIVMNVADFTRINDEKGYELGDAILVAMADILQQCIGEGELLCRSEDSRFAAFVKSDGVDELEARISTLMNSIQRQVYAKLGVHIFLLVGVCGMGDDGVSVVGAIDRAITAQKTIRDRAFYTESLIAYYDGVMRDKIAERRDIESHMMEALNNNEFHVYYQPKVNIETGKVVGAEALVRWIRPNGEVVSPGKFVPIFEENGFITEMDFAIYRQAVADIARWMRMDIDVPLISLNVSRRHIADDDFCDKFNALVNALNVPREYIELEITESMLTENLNKLVDVATKFKDLGYRISIDDFGSGYSSLNLITMMPFDTLKIDGGFFLRNDLSEKNKKVITSVVSLAKSLNLETVSEGVETQNQVDFLKDLGCDMIQGFFYYKPMPGPDFEKVIATQNKRTTN
ncbi:MAG: EAL domain-containing protein [Oscillospiraceae bacterium]|nr:EAL domain-containing protein [Oscillospiraceae bacterium]